MQKERSYILVSVAPLGCSSEGSREQSVSWLTPTSPLPPCSSLGQKGRHQVQEDAQNLVPIDQKFFHLNIYIFKVLNKRQWCFKL